MKILVPILFVFVAVSSFVTLNNTKNTTKAIAKDTMMADRQRQIDELKVKYAGKLEMPAESVFKNIKTLKGKSVEGVLSVMNNWGHALGVTCKFCHDLNDFSSEKPRHFNQTREMFDMTAKLNKEILASLKTFRQPVTMSCYSCHQEQKEPPH